MKTPIHSVLALCLGLVSSPQLLGQWELQARAGVGASRLNTDMRAVISRGEHVEVRFKPSWSVGLVASHPITDNLRISTGVIGSAFHGLNEHWIADRMGEEQEYKLQYLYLPLLVKYQWHRVYIGAGYRCGIPLHVTGTITQHYDQVGMADQRSSSHNLKLLRMDIGVVAEAGVTITEKVGGGVHYYRSMCDVRYHWDGLMASLSPEQFTLALSYRLLPKSKKAPAEPATPPPTAPEKL